MTVLLKIFIGILLINIDIAAAEDAKIQTNAEAKDDLLVEVEQTNLLPSDITGVYYLVPYRNRREKWAKTFGISYSNFNPINYEPNFVTANFSDIYTSSNVPLLELRMGIKRNFALGSIEGEFGIGSYSNSSDPTLVAADLSLIPIHLGMVYNLDNLFFEPYVVPYIGGGAYSIFYKESISGAAFGGNTQPAPYVNFGLAMQLNWIDREAARISYLDSGIENTFLFLEGRKLIASFAAKDPDFSTGIDWGAGVRLEF